MKVIYEANDGTKFESEVDCKNYEISTAKQSRFKELQEFIGNNLNYYSDSIVTGFIIENINEINKILDAGNSSSKNTFTGKDGEVYKAVDDHDNSCTKCAFKLFKHIEGENCSNSKEQFNCYDNQVIWIKK